MPWIASGNRSAFVWSVMGSALEASKENQSWSLRYDTDWSKVPSGEIIAQACATLHNMYPGRFALGVGTGEAMNEAMFLPQGVAHRGR